LAEKIFGAKRTRELTKLVSIQSCVREALALAELGGVHAMHDLTEGGLVASLKEMAEASNLGFEIKLEKIPVSPEAQKSRRSLNSRKDKFSPCPQRARLWRRLASGLRAVWKSA